MCEECENLKGEIMDLKAATENEANLLNEMRETTRVLESQLRMCRDDLRDAKNARATAERDLQSTSERCERYERMIDYFMDHE